MRRWLNQLVGHDEAMPLYPHFVNRFANSGPGLCLAVFAVSQLSHVESSWILFIAVIGGMTLMIRGYRMGVLCNESAVVVYGLFSTRTIAKTAITSGDTDVDGFPLSVGEPRAIDGGGPQSLLFGESLGSSTSSA